MKIKELIDFLETINPETEVVSQYSNNFLNYYSYKGPTKKELFVESKGSYRSHGDGIKEKVVVI